eukprot:TRINITY_DN14503_c0_g1_i1.p1 TRINITY_DN14503_c0_g1~~TRINITY_DN14503_c0_g1_i1.p1  ORF type:complete len:544 (+),score=112.14 TRINITY_DN14503_c0_g1_i1:238-1869(+)
MASLDISSIDAIRQSASCPSVETLEVDRCANSRVPATPIGIAQEGLALLLAFTMGWLLFRPLCKVIFQKNVMKSGEAKLEASYHCRSASLMSQKASAFKDTRPKDMEQMLTTHPMFLTDDLDRVRGDLASLKKRRPSPALFRALANEGRPDIAVDMWISSANAVGASEGLPEADLYSAAFEAAVTCGDFESAIRLATRANWQSPLAVPGQIAFLSLARWLARRQDVARAGQCINAVLSAGGQIDLPTLRSLVIACARCGNATQAAKHFETMQALGLEPDSITYSAMIRCCCCIGDAEEGLSYLKKMLHNGLCPDLPLFDALLQACASCNSLVLTERVLEDMQRLGIKPSNCTLAILVTLYSSRGELHRAIQAFEEMPRQYKLEPNAHAYSALIAACCNHGRPDLALQAYQEMPREICSPGARTYERLIQSCLRLGDLNKAVAIVNEALCLRSCQQIDEDSAIRSIHIDPKVVEELLRLAARRGQAQQLCAPLLARLRAARFEIDEALAESITSAAEAQSTGLPRSALEARRAFLQQRRKDIFN